ncbi:MAG: hypothetical protein KJ579_05255 [Verrucomicrobia bacterium]|jgi:hypothetical protein|nr:hypothetical protein [Verrucomicrobiota bacterium]OQW97603.1 MAG: hypothetical protein BWK77_01320 [Verrucomicrobia bacterium A1]
MKNVTITLPEAAAQWARVWAARNGTSVSRMVGDLLRLRMEQEGDYEAAMRGFLGEKPRRLKSAGGYPRRGDLYERAVLR